MASRYEQLQYLLESMQADKEKRQRVIDAGMSALRSSDTYQMIMEKCKNGKMLKPEEWKIIEQTLQKCLPGFLTNLKGVYDFSQTEWRISLLTKFGFSPSEMAVAISLTKVAIFSKGEYDLRLDLPHPYYASSKQWLQHVTIRIYAITEAEYYYLQSLAVMTTLDSGTIFDTEPGITSNVSGGAGIFCVESVSSVSFEEDHTSH